MRALAVRASVIVALVLMGSVQAAHAGPLQANQGRRGGVLEGRSIDTTFRMEKGGVVDLEGGTGTMIVTGGSGTDVRIRATVNEGRVRLRASSTLATLRASSEYGMSDVRYEITVPAGIRVLMEAHAGEMRATGLRGDIEIETISANVRLDDISGLASVETISGIVTASRLTGGANIETTSGDVTLTGVTGETSVESTSGALNLSDIRAAVIDAETVSGEVRFQGSVEAGGRYEFSSHSGTIRLAIPPNAGALLSLSTYSGTVNSDFPITLQQGSSSGRDKQLQFRLGSGNARLTAESFSGNIIITRGIARDRQE